MLVGDSWRLDLVTAGHIGLYKVVEGFYFFCIACKDKNRIRRLKEALGILEEIVREDLAI